MPAEFLVKKKRKTIHLLKYSSVKQGPVGPMPTGHGVIMDNDTCGIDLDTTVELMHIFSGIITL